MIYAYSIRYFPFTLQSMWRLNSYFWSHLCKSLSSSRQSSLRAASRVSHHLASSAQKENARQTLPLPVSRGSHAGTGVTQALHVGRRERCPDNEQQNHHHSFQLRSPQNKISVTCSWIGYENILLIMKRIDAKMTVLKTGYPIGKPRRKVYFWHPTSVK